MKKINFFFAAPATKDPKTLQLYRKILDGLVSFDLKITYDWLNDLIDYDGNSTTKKAIHAIQISDIFIAEISQPSTGVGSQIAIAQTKKIPVILLEKEGSKKVNTFFKLSGAGNEVTTLTYTEDTLNGVLRSAIQEVSKGRYVKFNFIATPAIYQKIESEAKKSKLSKSEYLRGVLEGYFGL